MARSSTTWGSLAMLALSCGMTGPASAEEGVFMKNLLGNLGVIDQPREPINYRERAPLAVPPKLDLPPPSGGAAARDASWPADTDVVRHQRAVADSMKPVPFPNDNRPSQGAVLPRDELDKKRKRTAGRDAPGPREVYGDGRLSTWISPDELKKGTDKSDPSKLKYGEEPERDTLLQPPTGYRMPAGNAPLASTKGEPVGILNKDARPEQDYLRSQSED